jgi:hypothetical protein
MRNYFLAPFLVFFLIVSGLRAQVVITEIMYNPPESGVDSLEYLEIYNAGSVPVNLEGWSFVGVTFTYPAITLAPGAYSVTCVRLGAFQSVFGGVALQWTGGALSNQGEAVRLLDAANNIVDEVVYSNMSPWPGSAAGLGASLVLCDPAADNSNPANWQSASTPIGKQVNGQAVLANPGAGAGCGGTNQLTANNDSGVAESGTTATLPVLANDLLPNPVLSLSMEIPPMHGTASIFENTVILYTSDQEYCGTDQLVYRVCDAGICDTATVTISVFCFPPYSIGTATTENANGVADSLQAFATLSGTVYGVNLRPGISSAPALLFTIIDFNTKNGIAVSRLNGNLGYTVQEGDRVEVKGRIGQFNGQTEIQPIFLTKQGAGNPLLSPMVVVAPDESTESRLIRINNLKLINQASWTTGMGGSGFTCLAVSADYPQDTIAIRIDRDVETFNALPPGEPFDITGIGGQFDSTEPYFSGYQILPRYNADFTQTISVEDIDPTLPFTVLNNPSTGLFEVLASGGMEEIAVFNSGGQVILTNPHPESVQRIDLTNHPVGTYRLAVRQQNRWWSALLFKSGR